MIAAVDQSDSGGRKLSVQRASVCCARPRSVSFSFPVPYGCLLFAVSISPSDLCEVTFFGVEKENQTCPERSGEAADSRARRHDGVFVPAYSS